MTHQTYEVSLTDWQWTLVKITLINQQTEWQTESPPSQAKPVIKHSADKLTYILSRIDAASSDDSAAKKELPDGP